MAENIMDVNQNSPVMADRPSWFEEYKLVLEDTARLVERRYSVMNYFIAANFSVLVTSGAILIAGNVWMMIRVGFLFLLMATGMTLNYFWYRFLKVSVDATDYRYKVLEKIEHEMRSNVMLYNRERDRSISEESLRRFTLKKLFFLLPIAFMTFYSLALLLLAVALFLGQFT